VWYKKQEADPLPSIAYVMDSVGELTDASAIIVSKRETVSGFIKEFELVPGDRVRLTMPASEPFPAGWAEGIVLTAKHYGEGDGWYIELEKDKVSPGWQKGYGYWKQGIDGGTVVKVKEEDA